MLARLLHALHRRRTAQAAARRAALLARLRLAVLITRMYPPEPTP